MADTKVSHDQLLLAFLEVFRNVGYDGASLQMLAEASGLKKSSLYHRFPGGKKEMATEVLKLTRSWIGINVKAVLKGSGDPEKRLEKALKHLNEFYVRGSSSCILKALSTDSGIDLFPVLINGAFDDLIEGFTQIAIDFGSSVSESQRIAEDIIIKIQGSLILSKGKSNPEIFNRTLTEIENSLKKLR